MKIQVQVVSPSSSLMSHPRSDMTSSPNVRLFLVPFLQFQGKKVRFPSFVSHSFRFVFYRVVMFYGRHFF